jgi:hypothetical protein
MGYATIIPILQMRKIKAQSDVEARQEFQTLRPWGLIALKICFLVKENSSGWREGLCSDLRVIHKSEKHLCRSGLLRERKRKTFTSE